ncbi:MAG: sulfatase-like hydrolase/transferase [Victivallales bacterium]|nr:sulfatase-like hydrolase/transferase [Victivallales bacterium]
MQSHPNIVMFVSDDQGAWALGCAGNDELKTPTLDKLAANGVRFENFFCVSPVCSPARASLLTGRIPSDHGIQDWLRKGNIDDPEGNFSGRDRAIGYLNGLDGFTDYLAQAGYVCGFSGKWHLGDSARPQKGYSYWEAYAFGGGDYNNYVWLDHGKPYRRTDYVTDYVTEKAIDFLHERHGKTEPFMLSVHYTAPHSPWAQRFHPPEIWHQYDNCPFNSTPNLPRHPWQSPTAPQGYTPESRRENLQGYYTAITAMDTGIGHIMAELERMEILQDTLVIFSGDNGMNMGHHGIWGKGNGTFPLNMYDTSVKIPFIISWAGHIRANWVANGLHSHYDVFPTILDIAGIKNPLADRLPGHSFAHNLLEGNDEGEENVVVYDEYGPVRMIRSKDWKYVHRYPYGPHELYHLADDPDETQNLVDSPEYASRVTAMRSQLRNWFAKYVNPSRDAVYEGVNGFGQNGMTGLEANGECPWEQPHS